MTSPNAHKPLDPAAIDRAPIVPDTTAGTEAYLTLIGDLSAELEARSTELEQLKERRASFEEIVAEMLRPYSDAVYWFVVCYCIAVGAFLLLAGFRSHTGFALSDTVLAVISGSTAVSVIGLIGMVITGMFGVRSAKARKLPRK
jgi:hypothetical protein